MVTSASVHILVVVVTTTLADVCVLAVTDPVAVTIIEPVPAVLAGVIVLATLTGKPARVLHAVLALTITDRERLTSDPTVHAVLAVTIMAVNVRPDNIAIDLDDFDLGAVPSAHLGDALILHPRL